MGTAEVLLPYGPLEEVSYYLLPMAKKARVPVVIHLDHGLKKETCLKALELGFTSIMYDCSTDSYEENVKKVREMADIAHSYGATIEGELGHVGGVEGGAGAEDDHDPTKFYTDPEQAIDFVERTKVDALAIAVGTAHGAYKLPPKLDFQRIETIANKIDVPLVLHGGSGLTDSDFKTAIEKGISKVNIFTDINIAAVEAEFRAFTDMKNGLIDLIPAAVEAIRKAVVAKLELFGSCGKGYANNTSDINIDDIVAKVTREVLAHMGK
jgi:fructose-bisphosphate aldolase class II